MQKITSAGTSLNQIPAIFADINRTARDPVHFWGKRRDVLDYGGGKYNKFTEKLAEMHIRNWVLDPFNRPEEHNTYVRRMLQARGADLGICANVLNVIREPAIRQEILTEISLLTVGLALCVFSVHDGNRSSRGKRTTKGWQANRPLKSYVREIKKNGNFAEVEVIHGRFIKATNIRS